MTHRIEKYAEFRDIWERDTITIEIHNRELGEEGPYQIIVYTASHAGIQAKSLPCTRHGRTWRQDELQFNEIALIDAGTSPRTALTQVLEEEALGQEAKDNNGSVQSASSVFHVRNGFTAQGLLALPITQHKREEQALLPLLRREAMEQLVRLN